MKTPDLEKGRERNHWMRFLEAAWATGTKLWRISIMPKINGRRIWRLSIIRKRWYSEWTSEPSNARRFKNIKNIYSKASKYGSSSSKISSRKSDSSLSSDSKQDTRNPGGNKEIKILYHVLNNNLNKKRQCNDEKVYKPKFDGKFSLSRYKSMDPLP